MFCVIVRGGSLEEGKESIVGRICDKGSFEARSESDRGSYG